MSTQDLTLMQAAIDKMHWHEARQKVIAKNIANADTAGYQPQDIQPMDFKNLLESSSSKHALGAASGGTTLATTNAKHLTVGGGVAGTTPSKAKNEKSPYETSPTGNAVILEEQLLRMNQNFTDHRLTTTIYQKSFDMLKASIK